MAVNMEVRRSALCRLAQDRGRWRVLVESWPEGGLHRGRLLFRLEGGAVQAERESAPLLEGATHEEVVSRGHDFNEEQLRRVLNSL